MNNMIKNVAIYITGIVAFLVALAAYFFFMMNKSLHKQGESVQIAQEAPSKKEAPQCETTSNDAANRAISNDISRIQSDYSECSSSLTKTSTELSALKNELQTIRLSQTDKQDALRIEIQAAKASADELRSQIENLEAEKQQLIADIASDQDMDAENTAEIQSSLEEKTSENLLLSSQITSLEQELLAKQNTLDEQQAQEKQLETEFQSSITALEQENSVLISRINELEASIEESTSDTSGQLAIAKFETLPVFCDAHISPSEICVSSFEMVTTFNFRPSGFISLRLIGPDGSTIQRESIAAQEVNLYSFVFNDEIFSAGEYTVEIKIDDVFNRFNSEQRFSLTLPTDLVNQFNSGQ